MDTSTKKPSPASSILQNPFQDPNSSGRSSISSRSVYPPQRTDIRDSRASVPIDPAVFVANIISDNEVESTPQAPGAAHTRNSSSSSLRRMQQSRYVPPRRRYSDDDQIQSAVPSLTPSMQGVPFHKPWLDKHTSFGDESTTSSLSTRRPLPEQLDRTPKALKTGGRWILFTKWVFISVMISAK